MGRFCITTSTIKNEEYNQRLKIIIRINNEEHNQRLTIIIIGILLDYNVYHHIEPSMGGVSRQRAANTKVEHCLRNRD